MKNRKVSFKIIKKLQVSIAFLTVLNKFASPPNHVEMYNPKVFLNFCSNWLENFDKIRKNFEKLQKFPLKWSKIVKFSLLFKNILKMSPAPGVSHSGPLTRRPSLQALPWWTSLPPRKIPAGANMWTYIY